MTSSKLIILFVGFTLSGAPDVWTRDPVREQYQPLIKYITRIAKNELKKVQSDARRELVEIRRQREEDPNADGYEKSAGSIIFNVKKPSEVHGGYDRRLDPAFSKIMDAAAVAIDAYVLGMKAAGGNNA